MQTINSLLEDNQSKKNMSEENKLSCAVSPEGAL